MALENVKDLQGFSESDLRAELINLEAKYQKMKFEHTVKGLENPLDIRVMRKNIARINTELRQRELTLLSPEELSLRTKMRARRSKSK